MLMIKYNPGRTAVYLVEGAPTRHAAFEAFLDHNGYNPGVPYSTFRCVDFVPVVLPEYRIKYRPVSKERLHAIAMSMD
jgi:hypothetical protein